MFFSVCNLVVALESDGIFYLTLLTSCKLYDQFPKFFSSNLPKLFPSRQRENFELFSLLLPVTKIAFWKWIFIYATCFSFLIRKFAFEVTRKPIRNKSIMRKTSTDMTRWFEKNWQWFRDGKEEYPKHELTTWIKNIPRWVSWNNWT